MCSGRPHTPQRISSASSAGPFFGAPGREQPYDQLSGRETQQSDALFDDRSGSDAGRKGRGKEAKLSYHGHLMTENRNGLVVNTLVTTAYGAAECHAGLLMAEKLPGSGRVTLGADKGYDQLEFIDELRQMEITPMWRKTRVDAGAGWTGARLGTPVMR
jgi:Transposase DDE domain